MKISQSLHQFQDSPTALIVVSGHDAHIYVVQNGEVEEVKEFHVKSITYSDREGFFQQRNRSGGTMRSGGPVEKPKDKEMQEFLSLLEKNIHSFSQEYKVERAYLFAPEHLEPSVVQQLKPEVKDKLEHTFHGDYTEKTPVQLVEKIDTYKKSKKVTPTKPEAKKILDKK